MVYHIKFNLNDAVNHNKFYQSCQYVQNDSVALTIFRHLIHEFKTPNNMYTGVLISPWPDHEGNKLGSMSGTRTI